MSPESTRVTPDFVRFATIAPGAFTELRQNIADLAQLMGSRRRALSAIARATNLPVSRIQEILAIPEATPFSAFRDPSTGEPIDLDSLLPDQKADTAEEAVGTVSNAGLRRILEEVMSS